MSGIRFRLENWAKWVYVCNLETNGYPRATPFARLIRSNNAGEEKSEPASDLDFDDGEEFNQIVLKLPTRPHQVLVAHYTTRGAAVKKAYRLHISIRTYWENLKVAEDLLEKLS